jgi:hypothetical protein
MRVLFGQLQSDQPDLLNGDLEEAENCVPYINSYGPFPEPVGYSAPAPDVVRGAYSTKDLSGTVFTVLATEGRLYKESSTALNDISRTASYTTANDGPNWEFETFGNTVIAANGADPMQVFTIGTSSAFVNQSASASAPIARHIAVVRDFLFTGHQPNLENRAQWSRINNPLRFGVSQRFQSDFQDLPGTDQIIKKVTGGDFAAILTNTSIWRATYVGSPLIFRFDELARNVGCFASGSAARFQNITFFLSGSGMYAFDGQSATPIGLEQVDEKILDEINLSFLHRVTSTIDPVNRLYLMAYPSTASTDGTCNRIAIYSWAKQRWAFASETIEVLFNHMTSGYTLEGLDALGNLETLAFSLDSSAYQGGLSALSCANGLHQIARFTGDAKTARFTTGEAELVTDARAFVRSLRPLVQGSSTTTVNIEVGGRDRLVDPVVWGSASIMNATGTCPVRANHRYHRLRMSVSGGFDRVIGSEVEFTKEGVR